MMIFFQDVFTQFDFFKALLGPMIKQEREHLAINTKIYYLRVVFLDFVNKQFKR